MKRTLLLFLCITGMHAAEAQFAEHHAIYGTSELNLGNYSGLDFGLNYVFEESYSFKIGYSANFRQPKTQPRDYSSGLVGVWLYGTSNPYDQIKNFQITVGKIVQLNESGTIRVNLSMGLGSTTIKEPENWEKIQSNYITENYNWEYGKYNTISLIINPKIEFPFSRFYGLTVSPMVQISKERTYFGLGLGQMIGLLRKKREYAYNNRY